MQIASKQNQEQLIDVRKEFSSNEVILDDKISLLHRIVLKQNTEQITTFK